MLQNGDDEYIVDKEYFMAKGTSGTKGTLGIQPGQMIDEFKIIGKIGKGGMATVYKAYQVSMDRYVAIKILSFQLIDNEEFLGRFKQEARLVARLEHPNILPVYAYGEDHSIPYLVMRFLNAGTLKETLRTKIHQQELKWLGAEYSGAGYSAVNNPALVKSNPPPLTLKEIDNIFSQLADALSYAHDNGVIHRDIKPSNVMLDQRGTVFLTDFGIAKLLESSGGNKETIPQFTPTGAITGTPDYMSPEQAQGLHLDQRSDIYSVGIVLFEMLTGKVPFDAETPIAVIMKHISEPLPRPSVFNPNIHPALEGVVVKALEKSPAARYASMHEFKLAWKNALLEMALGTAAQDAAAKKSPIYHSPEKPTSSPATPAPETPSSKINIPAGSPSSPSSPAWTPAQSTAAENSSPMNSVHSNTSDEDNKFLLRNLQISTSGQLSKTASSREGMGVGAGYSGAKDGKEHRFGFKAGRVSQASQAQQNSKRILWIAGGVALAVLVIIGLAVALNVFDFIREARQIPIGWIP